MTDEARLILGITTEVFFVLFMLGSGIWVALDAKKHGRPASEYIIWGVFTGAFVFLGLIIYLLWRKYVLKYQE